MDDNYVLPASADASAEDEPIQRGTTKPERRRLRFTSNVVGSLFLLNDLTLKFYSATGVLLGSIDNQFGGDFFSATDIGNGSAGFIFDVSAGEQAAVNALLGNTAFMALEATVTGVHGGPETFAIVNLSRPGPIPEPATWAMMLLGFGGIGMAMRRRRAKAGQLLQIA